MDWRHHVDADDAVEGVVVRKLRGQAAAQVPVTRATRPMRAPYDGAGLLLVTALNAGLAQQLAVLLLSHPLAALLDY
jgi:hypothetical protein